MNNPLDPKKQVTEGITLTDGIGRKLLSRTHFQKSRNDQTNQWEWYWATESPNGEVVGDGGEGYERLVGSLNGFFAQQGVPFKPVPSEDVRFHDQMPPGYTFQKIDAQHYVINKIEIKKSKSESKGTETQ